MTLIRSLLHSLLPLLAMTMFLPAHARELQGPLKSARTLHTDAEIARARANVAKYPAARKIADGILKTADYWLPWDDRDLRDLITSSDVPRAFDVGTAGCPKCGMKLYEKFGTYPWIVDPKLPFKVKCPVDGTVYPSNDYATYYKSGFKTKIGWDTPYVDDGWGWKGPDGTKSWFVAHWNHEMWHKYIAPGVQALGRAYLLTGDRRYAHKAAVMLARIAEVYPAMDHENQSRYGEIMKAQGGHYPGKVVNYIWETGLLQSLGDGYDDIWETIDGDAGLQTLYGKDGPALRAFIEANVLEEGIRAYHEGKMRGNFGMHQASVVTLALARQSQDRDKLIDDLFTHPGGPLSIVGIDYAFYNLIYRDGFPFETSPHYNFLWVETLTQMANLLEKAGRNTFANPRMKTLYDAPLALINAGQFTPDLGDAGSAWGSPPQADPDVYQTAYAHYHDPRYAQILAQTGAAGEGVFPSYESLFRPPVPADQGKKLPPQKPRLLDGVGLAILNNPADTISTTLYYGLRGGHSHQDRLGFELFALGQPMMPDLGYPDAMNTMVKGIYTWSKNTISHNTVTVDAGRQPGNLAGQVRLFADSPFARVVDVDAPGTYPQCSAYRRALFMVDAGKDRSYYVDVFTVEGGKEHDYSLHGPPGTFDVVGGTWSDPAKGTLAGENVPVGEIYDAPDIAKDAATKGYDRYMGSGFQHFVNVRRHEGGNWVAHWTHAKDKTAELRIRVLHQPGQQVMLANAQVSPINHPEMLTYVLARRTGEDLKSRFVSVIEPYRGKPFIEDARLVESGEGGTVIEVKRADGLRDVILYNPSGTQKTLAAYSVKSDAPAAVFTVDASGRISRIFAVNGSITTGAGSSATEVTRAAYPIRATVISVHPKQRAIVVRLPEEPGKARASLSDFLSSRQMGRYVTFKNSLHRTVHEVQGFAGDVILVNDDLTVGRFHVTSVKPGSLGTDTLMVFAPNYPGTWAVAEDGTGFQMVKSADDGVYTGGGDVTLTKSLPEQNPFRAGKDAWLVDVGPGDEMEIPGKVVWWNE